MQLEQLLDGLDVSVSPFAVCEVRGETGLVLKYDEAAALHYVLSGTGIARTASGTEISLRPHTVLITPAAAPLTVTCGARGSGTFPAPRCRPLPGGWEMNTVGEGAPGLVMACGAVECNFCTRPACSSISAIRASR